MKRGLCFLAMVMLVAALANAAVTNPVDTSEATVAPASELVPTEFDLTAFLQLEAENVSFACAQQTSDAELFSGGLKPSRGQSCGGNICGKFQYCCNPSCGTCVYYGMSCTMQSCN